eukprot:TRINITY_DN7307_c0_g1_i1.p1 TRINITY_DN7307_c0_g1~~TRINITY_DN7307_c0_g1_i1.p1  ORF type:complete len:482 (+),score=125.13 TRINITY_DN7307_c0_g1_i1:82-1446(+)
MGLRTACSLVALGLVCAFRWWCDLWPYSHIPIKISLHNKREENITMCWLGMLSDASPWPTNCWDVRPGAPQSFDTHIDHAHLLSAPSGWWTMYTVLPGWTMFTASPSHPGGWSSVMVSWGAAVRNIHALGLHPMVPVGMLMRNRESVLVALVACCAAALLWLAQQDAGPGREPRPPSRRGDAAQQQQQQQQPAGDQPTTHDLLKAVAVGPMMLNHLGRMVFLSGTNAWWYVPSQWLCVAFYFFLTGAAAAAKRPGGARRVLWTLGCYCLLRWTLNPRAVQGGSILLSHVFSWLLFYDWRPAEWSVPQHCAACCALLLLSPLLGDGFGLDGGGVCMLYCGVGACVHRGAERTPAAAVWLGAATLGRTAQILRAELIPMAQAGGGSWAAAGPAVVGGITLPVNLWVLWKFRRQTLQLHPAAARAVRWVGKHSLLIYVGHTVLFEGIARYAEAAAPV